MKIVAKARNRHNRFGYVTMATAEEAKACIDALNDTELKGRKITIEVVRLHTCTHTHLVCVQACNSSLFLTNLDQC